MDVKESYRVLELEIGASRTAVDAAYCRLIERWHPDRAASGGPEAIREAQRMVQAINDAYQTLAKIAPNTAPPALSPSNGPMAPAPLPGDLSRRAGGVTDPGLAAASNRVPGQTPAGQPHDRLGALSKIEGQAGTVSPPPVAPAKPKLTPLSTAQQDMSRPPPPRPPPETWAARPAPVASATPALSKVEGPPPTPASPPAPAPTKSPSPPPAPQPPALSPSNGPTSPAPLPGDLSHRAGGVTDPGLAATSNRVPGQTPAGQPHDWLVALSKIEGPAAPPTPFSDLRSKAVAFYDMLFPAGSPRRRFGPVILAAALIFVLLLGKCAFSSSGGKSAAAPDPRTTGRLVVKSNVANAIIEAARIILPGDRVPPSFKGTIGQALSGLPPGRYDVTARSEGWPDAHGEVNLEAGRTTEAAINFKSGSLRLDSNPAGATVRLGETVLGPTPLVIPQLPPGECQLSLEYPSWPVVSFKTTITENVESTGTVRLPHGKLTVKTTPPGATVLLGKRALGQTPLTLEHFPAGTKKLTLQAKNFPPLNISVTVEDGGEVTASPALGSGFPVLDPAALLRYVWVPDNPDHIAPPLEGLSGPSKPQNDIIRNLDRKRLYEIWLRKRYCYAATVKSYDRASGQVEFAEQECDLSKYRVLAKLSVEARNDPDLTAQLIKGATFAFYGRLSAVEEPRWMSKVITFEFSSAEPLR